MRLFYLLVFLFLINFSNAQNQSDSITIIFKKSNYFKKIKKRTNGRWQPYVYIKDIVKMKDVYINVDNEKNNFIYRYSPMDEPVFLYHGLEKLEEVTFLKLKKGDIVEVSYTEGYPFFTILNRETKPFDVNFYTQTKLYFMFTHHLLSNLNKKSFEGNNDNKFHEYIENHRIKLTSTIDSLKNLSLISNDVADLYYKNGIFGIKRLKNENLKECEKDLLSDELIGLYWFDAFLIQYLEKDMGVTFANKEDLKTRVVNGKLIKSDNDNETENYKVLFEKVENSTLFSPKIKIKALYYLLNKLRNQSDVVSYYFNRFKNYCNDAELLSNFEKDNLIGVENLKQIRDKLILFDSDKNQFSLEDIISKNKGKVIIVDIWKTLYAPCLKDISYSLEITKEFKNVNFIYLCIESPFDQWKSTCNSIKLPKENSFFIINPKASEWFLNLEIYTLPRYMIIDKKGELINSETIRPSNAEFKNNLKKYL